MSETGAKNGTTARSGDRSPPAPLPGFVGIVPHPEGVGGVNELYRSLCVAYTKGFPGSLAEAAVENRAGTHFLARL